MDKHVSNKAWPRRTRASPTERQSPLRACSSPESHAWGLPAPTPGAEQTATYRDGQARANKNLLRGRHLLRQRIGGRSPRHDGLCGTTSTGEKQCAVGGPTNGVRAPVSRLAQNTSKAGHRAQWGGSTNGARPPKEKMLPSGVLPRRPRTARGPGREAKRPQGKTRAGQ